MRFPSGPGHPPPPHTHTPCSNHSRSLCTVSLRLSTTAQGPRPSAPEAYSFTPKLCFLTDKKLTAGFRIPHSSVPLFRQRQGPRGGGSTKASLFSGLPGFSLPPFPCDIPPNVTKESHAVAPTVLHSLILSPPGRVPLAALKAGGANLTSPTARGSPGKSGRTPRSGRRGDVGGAAVLLKVTRK